MAAPPKPWEKAGVNFQSSGAAPINNMSGQPPGSSLPPCCQPGATAAGASPPPIPSRPSQQSTYGSRFSNTYGGYSPYSSMSSMYSSPYSSYGMGYSPYSSYGGMGYNRMGYGYGDYGAGNMQNSLAMRAEESSRPAFQSIESIVNAFTSVSMMLDSTFQAVYSSFRAVVGVADNFTRLKSQIAQVFSAFAVFRFLRYLYRKLLVLLRLRPPGYAEEAWSQAVDTFGKLGATGGQESIPNKSTWPIMLFFGVILGGPWVIWRMISSLTETPGSAWASGVDDHFVVRAKFDFQGSTDDELSFKAGQLIKVAPKELQPRMKGWLLASVDGTKTGIIPANYVTVLGKKRGSRHEQNTPSPIQHTQSEAFINQTQDLVESSQVPTEGQMQEVSAMATQPKSCCSKKQSSSQDGNSLCNDGDQNEVVSRPGAVGNFTPGLQNDSLETEFSTAGMVNAASGVKKDDIAEMDADEILGTAKQNIE